jgi:hypothetical protein
VCISQGLQKLNISYIDHIAIIYGCPKSLEPMGIVIIFLIFIYRLKLKVKMALTLDERVETLYFGVS